MRLALAILPLLLGTSALAAKKAADPKLLVVEFATAVKSGGSLDPFKLNPALSATELKTMSALAGCVASIAEGSFSYWIKLDWSCPSRPAAERQTALKLSDDGSVSVWINPAAGQLSPTAVASARADRNSLPRINRQFGLAVKTGKDPTLGGLITIIPEHLEKLSALRGLEYVVPPGNTQKSQALFWDLKGKVFPDPIVTNLEFDDSGRPIGLILSGTSKVPGKH